MYRVAGLATRINADKSENTFWSSKSPEIFSQILLQENIFVLVSCAVESSADLWLSRDAFFKKPWLSGAHVRKVFLQSPMTSRRQKWCKSAGAGSSGLHVAKNGICKLNVDCKV